MESEVILKRSLMKPAYSITAILQDFEIVSHEAGIEYHISLTQFWYGLPRNQPILRRSLLKPVELLGVETILRQSLMKPTYGTTSI